MVFSNIFFMYVFLPALFIAYFAVKNDSYRRAVLVAFSLLFYAWGEPVYVFLMVGMVLCDYVFGILISRTEEVWLRKFWLVIAVVSNLGILGVYKYLGFFTETLNFIFNVNIPVVELTLPIGISFFTFQTMSYVVDVYREDAEVQKSFFKLLLYVSFFPQLVAGPIVRYKDIEMQLSDRKVSIEKINDGMFRFSVGLAKKVLIADCCDTALTALLSLSDVTFVGRWTAALFYTLQLYFDFSGYSDMAIGLGRMFGFEFLENFNYPLISRSATEFWRRWHMSLGTFFRDYVYIPLGGNRHDHQRNILVVWFLTGLWHGASWNYIIWGMYYGFLLMWEKKHYLKKMELLPKPVSFVISHVYTLFITIFGFAVFYFETDTLKNLGYLFGIGCSAVNDIFTKSIIMDNIILLSLACVFASPIVPTLWNKLKARISVGYSAERIIKTVVVIAFVALSSVRLVGDTYSAFLYFRY